MYNIHKVKKNTVDLEDQKKTINKRKAYIERYYSSVRPSLIDNYNKRINSFIRKMEEEPTKIHLDESKKDIKEDFEQKFIGKSTFRFRDHSDWNSMYTAVQRLERQKNTVIFQKKYGDASLAYRSICSQSQYNPNSGNQFRSRDKNKEINPPMKYTNKIVYRNLKLKKRNKRHDDSVMRKQNGQESLKRGNTASSNSVAEDDILTINHSYHKKTEGDDEDSVREKEQKKKQKKKESKLHFKQLIDLETNMKDQKNKKILKDLLYKCGVYRKKGRRAVTQYEIDQLSEFDEK